MCVLTERTMSELEKEKYLKKQMGVLLKEHGYERPGKLLIHLGENGGVKGIEDTVYK